MGPSYNRIFECGELTKSSFSIFYNTRCVVCFRCWFPSGTENISCSELFLLLRVRATYLRTSTTSTYLKNIPVVCFLLKIFCVPETRWRVCDWLKLRNENIRSVLLPRESKSIGFLPRSREVSLIYLKLFEMNANLAF